MTIKFIQIVARSSNGIIGNGDDIPWRLPKDLAYFKEKTMNQVCIVGRTTYETIKFLKGRQFIVITSKPDSLPVSVSSAKDIDTSIELAKLKASELGLNCVMIIGGSTIYRQTFRYADKLLVTEIEKPFDGNAFYEIPSEFKLTKSSDIISDNGLNFLFTEYVK